MATTPPVTRNPFIVGSFVRGEDFFGRQGLVSEILEGERQSIWVLGARRLGKTSLLRELEHRVQRSRETPFVALYWDLQGSGDARGLAETLLSSVEDAEAFRRATDIGVEHLESLPIAEMISTLVRRTVRAGWRLLLLVDEAEELLVVGRSDATVLARLRRVLSRGPDVRCVITATRLLARVDEEARMPTSPFLQGFIPPVYLTPLAPEAGRALLGRGGFAAAEVELILQRTACHPFLLQLLASRLFETRDVAATVDQLTVDDMVANYFAVDFSTLEETERALLCEVAREGPLVRRQLATALGQPEDALATTIYGLSMLGYLAKDGESLRLGNWFFEHWLRRRLATPGRNGELPAL
ncbi:MAG TPA: AAA family ATPase [Vicinamibacteria bacterium]|nr:AAA family ATPase [Vicinamibacteria bacterium]